MYQRITHHIVEEHIHHPMGVGIAAEVAKRTAPVPHTTPTPSVPAHRLRARLAQTASAVQFQDRVHSAWADLVWRLRHYLVSVVSVSDDLAAVQAQIQTDIAQVTATLAPYLPTELVNRFDTALKALVSALSTEISAVKTNTRTPAVQGASVKAISDFAAVLAEINSQDWPVAAVVSIWNTARESLVDQTAARMTKDWFKDLQNVNTLHADLVSGSVDHPLGFAAIFAQGVINQNPTKFAG